MLKNNYGMFYVKMELKVLLAVVLASRLLGANGLDDLRKSLERLNVPGKLSGALSVKASEKFGSGKDFKETSGSASAQIEVGNDGLRVFWDLPQINKFIESKEKKQSNSAMDKISMSSIYRTLNAAPYLLQMLRNAQLIKEKADIHMGKPAQLLEIDMPSELDDDEGNNKKASSKKNRTVIGKMWISPEGTPLAFSSSANVKEKVLLMSVEMSQKRDIKFSLVANRLVITKFEERMQVKGVMGMDTHTSEICTFVPK